MEVATAKPAVEIPPLASGQTNPLWHAEAVTDPSWPIPPDGGWQPHQPPAYPPPYPPPYAPYPYVDPSAPYGRDPLTGEPLSDKSKVTAGLLQLIGLFGLLGMGRLYLGQTGLGVAQLLGGLVITVVTCGIGVLVPVIWGIVDAVLILSGKVRDQYGRPLRD